MMKPKSIGANNTNPQTTTRRHESHLIAVCVIAITLIKRGQTELALQHLRKVKSEAQLKLAEARRIRRFGLLPKQGVRWDNE